MVQQGSRYCGLVDTLLTATKPATSKKTLLISGAIAATVLSIGAAALLTYNARNEPVQPPGILVENGVNGAPPKVGLIDAPPNVDIIKSDDSPEILKMLEMAKFHEEFGELTAPPGSNALELYETILQLDPDHPIAGPRKIEILQLTGN